MRISMNKYILHNCFLKIYKITIDQSLFSILNMILCFLLLKPQIKKIKGILQKVLKFDKLIADWSNYKFNKLLTDNISLFFSLKISQIKYNLS